VASKPILDDWLGLVTLAAMKARYHPYRLSVTLALALGLITGQALAQSSPTPRPPEPPPKVRPKAQNAAPRPDKAQADPERYRACLELADTAPDKAYDMASVWVDESRSMPAYHCQAMSLMRLGQYAQAGEKLLVLADGARNAPKNVRSELLVQAGEVYLLAKSPQPALKALEEAHQLSPDDAGILADQGRAHILAKDWFKAVGALGQALSLDPVSADAWTLRATARRQAGQVKQAEEDVETALALDDTRADIWLERGLVDIAKSDKPKARKNLLRAIQMNDKSPVAEQARAALEAMDLKTKK